MSTLLFSLGRWSYRHPWRVLLTWLLLLAIGGGGAVFLSTGTDNSFTIPGTEAQTGLEQLARTFPEASGTSAQIVVVTPDDTGAVTEPAFRDPIDTTITDLERLEGVLAVTDPYDEIITGTISDDGTAAIIRLQFDGEATDISDDTIDELSAVVDDLSAALPAGTQVALGGDLFAADVPGLSIVELVGVVIALLVLIVTFRSFLLAGLPLMTALIGVALSMALILVATVFATVSSTTPLLALMLGLAVGIDYALFIVARHQDQVRGGLDPEESVARATGTAGSAVVFAGVTVLIALIGLSFAGIPFLTTMGIAASVAVAIAVAVSVTLTPAMLGFVKGRVIGWRRSARTRSQSDPPRRSAKPARRTRRGAERWVTAVTRRPVLTTVVVTLGLGLLAVPATALQLALPNAGVQPTSSDARISYDLTAEKFGPGANGPLVMTGTIVTSTDPLGLMEDLTREIERVPGVHEVALAVPNLTADTALIQVVPETAPDAEETAQLVRDLRELTPQLSEQYGVDLVVTGFTAAAIDISDRLGAALLPFGIFVVGLSLVLLAIVFRSVWVPVTAAAGYLLSIAAAFGVVALVFEFGVGADLLHVARTGPVISFMPIVLMGVLFGLAMDYQVFLVTRMREDYVHDSRARGGRADRKTAVRAVRSGFTASARVVTAAAIIMFAVFAAFVPEGDASLKAIALGLAVGIAIDAFLVRMTLVPAVMTLLGAKAWWLPRWMARILPHVDIEGDAVRREIELEQWATDTDIAVAAEGVELTVDGGHSLGEVTLFRDVDLTVRTGDTLLIQGDDARAARGLVLAIAGRLAPSDGLLRVGGHLLPARAAWVRAHVGVALLADSTDPAGDVERALRGGTRLVALDGLDTLDEAERDRVAAVLRDGATVTTRSGASVPLTVVASARREGAALSVLAEARRPSVSSLSLSPTPTPAEVNS